MKPVVSVQVPATPGGMLAKYFRCEAEGTSAKDIREALSRILVDVRKGKGETLVEREQKTWRGKKKS